MSRPIAHSPTRCSCPPARERLWNEEDAQGLANIPLATAGVWYIKFIDVPKIAKDSVDYESKWATLPFEVR